MTFVNARRVVAVVALALAFGALAPAGPVRAATGDLKYHCVITEQFSYDFTFDQDTNLPATSYLGKKYGYTATTTFPEAGVAFARGFKVAYIDGAIDATVYRNGSPLTVHAPIPRTDVPTGTNVMSLVAKGVLPAYTKGGGAPVVYKPGAIKFSVNAHRANGSSVFALNKGDCSMPANTRTIDTTKYVRSATKTAEALSYAKATKKVAAVARVTATSGVAPTGTVKFTLFRGSSAVKSISASMAGGKAKASFAAVSKKGGYKVVATYRGSTLHQASSASKAFTVR